MDGGQTAHVLCDGSSSETPRNAGVYAAAPVEQRMTLMVPFNQRRWRGSTGFQCQLVPSRPCIPSTWIVPSSLACTAGSAVGSELWSAANKASVAAAARSQEVTSGGIGPTS